MKGLCLDLRPVLEADDDPGILGDGHVIDHRQPVLIPEDRQRLSLLQTSQKQFDLLTSGLPVGDLLSQHLLTGLSGIETVHQSVVAFLVFGLIEGHVSAFFRWWKIGWKDEWKSLCGKCDLNYVDGFESSIRFPKKKNTAYGYEEVLAKHNKAVIESYDLTETDAELFITERVNNLLFRKNKMTGVLMNAEKAGTEDIEDLVKLRLSYLLEDHGSLDPQDHAAIKMELPGYFQAHLNKDLFVFVIRDGQNIVSCAFFLIVEKPMSPAFINGRTGMVLNVYTCPSYRRKGCAKRIMEELLSEAKKMEISVIELKVTEDGYPLYRSVGFMEDDSEYHRMKWKNRKYKFRFVDQPLTPYTPGHLKSRKGIGSKTPRFLLRFYYV